MYIASIMGLLLLINLGQFLVLWHLCEQFIYTHSVSPEKDPLCVLLMIDYYAIRSGEYQFLIDLFQAWEVRIMF